MKFAGSLRANSGTEAELVVKLCVTDVTSFLDIVFLSHRDYLGPKLFEDEIVPS